MTPDILISILFILSTILITALGFLIKAFRDQRLAIQAAQDIKVASISGEIDSAEQNTTAVTATTSAPTTGEIPPAAPAPAFSHAPKAALIRATLEQGTSPTMVQPKRQDGELGRAPNQGLLADIRGFNPEGLKTPKQIEKLSRYSPEQQQILNRRSPIADDTTEYISSLNLTEAVIEAHNIATDLAQPAPSGPEQPSPPPVRTPDLTTLFNIIPHFHQDAQSESESSEWSNSESESSELSNEV
ncbi:MAG: hypothetical protein VXW87_02465 [Pseudomonadota bacterium]|nr:hypothetical protein [Pseudomonadota bacterium]